MGLCENVYRRGGVYWWRRRGRPCHDAAGPYVHVSLKVRNPRQARALARLVSVEADRLGSVEMLDASQQKALLKAFIDNQVGHFDSTSGLFAHRDAMNGKNLDPLADRIRRDKAMAAIYAALGSRSVAADIGETETAQLRDAGFDDSEIETIRLRVDILRDSLPRLAADGTLSESGPSGLVGPPNAVFRQALRLLEADPSDASVDHARRLWLQAMSVVLRDAERRHATLDVSRADAVYRELFGAPPRDAPAPDPATVAAKPATAKPATAKSAPAKDRDFTISGQIAAMVETKRGVEWKITKRGVQDVSDIGETYVFLGRVMVKMLGADDVRKLDGRHAMELRQAIQSLPKAYGKAPKDWDLSFDEVIAKAKHEGKPLGRERGTIVKYLNCLQSFVRFLAGSGIDVAITERQIKEAKPRAKKQKANALRAAITDAEYRTLFANEEWTGADVVHDSTYWVPLFTRYGGGRLEEPCGLLIDEIDFDSSIPSYLIQENEMRTIKTEARRVPFHSELLRLGVREYCEAIKARGYKELFPDLRARGDKTSIGSLLSKKFTPIFDRALPSARSNKKTQHSSRKTLNTELRDEGIDITIRCEILGHAQEGVNAKVYTDPARDGDKKKAIESIANVTAHVPQRPLRLSPLLKGAERAH
jgi:hypothetical protein